MTSSDSPLFETLVVFFLVYGLQILTATLGGVEWFDRLFVLSAPLEADPWTVVTSIYAHAGVEHLVANCLALLVFGWPVARGTSSLRFHTFFIASGATAGVAHVVIAEALPGMATGGVLGASGAVFALMGYLLAANRLSDGLARRVDVPFWLGVGLFVLLAVLVTLATGSPEAALIAHGTGFLLGLFAGRAKLL